MKKKLGIKMCLYPMPCTIIGVIVDGKPNFTTIAHVGIMDYEAISLSVAKIHHTNKGIKENRVFSVNMPDVSLYRETDYCGIVSGRKHDKARIFNVVYGEHTNAPMIEECPINIECRLQQSVEFPHHDVFIGSLVETYCREDCLSGDEIDFSKVQPLLYIAGYYELGKRLSDAWKPGKEIKRQNLDS